MKYLSLMNDSLRIPLALVAACNYTKTANIIPHGGTQLTVTNRGFGCQEFAVSFRLDNATLHYLLELNSDLFGPDATLEWVIKRLITIEPKAINKTDAEDVMNPSHIYLAEQCICPELLFMLTSVTHTVRGDRNGRVLEADISMTFSGCKTSKQASVDPLLGDAGWTDVVAMPVPIVHVGAHELNCQEVVSICQYVLTPSTLTLQLDVSNVQNELQAFLISPLNTAFKSYIEIPGVNSFYIRNATFDEPFITYECDIFKPEAYENISKTYLNTYLSEVLQGISSRIPLVVHGNSLKRLPVDHYRANGTAVEILEELKDSLGFLVAYHEGYAHLFEVPETLSASDEIQFYITEDLMSSKTCKVIYRDSEHQYEVGTEGADAVVINSPVCTSEDRSENLLRYYNLMENQVTLDQPYDNRIRPMSIVRLMRDDTTSKDVMITNYTIDVLTNQMSLECHYVN